MSGETSTAQRIHPAERRWFGARLFVAIVAVIGIGVALTMLWRESAGIETSEISVGITPATLYTTPGAETAPLVVVAHGFAGSRQFMQAISLTLARSGYSVLAFDFAGHGRNTVPLLRDIASIDGTTRQLVNETHRAIDAGLTRHPQAGGLALVGHSMATDVLMRALVEREDVRAMVGISMFSQVVTAMKPERLLMISGQWEPGLRSASIENLQMVAESAKEGQTAQSGEVIRRAVFAPRVEHVGVLYSSTTLTETRDWLDAAFDRSSDTRIARHGPWVALLLGSIVALAWPLFSMLPVRSIAQVPTWRATLLACAIPSLVTPLVLWPIETDLLPVLIADYLAVHLGLYGILQCAVLFWLGYRLPPGPLWPALFLAFWGIGVFGLALDTFGASFMPHSGRLAIIGAVALGAIPFMLSDAMATAAGHAGFLRTVVVRFSFLASLGLAVALDFDNLFFLIMILPIILLFFVIYGTMGGWVGRRSGPLASGIGLGVILAWAIGVSFPLFAA
ncbi:MAG: alpha/beta fold hydrolase [Pseudomonadota bacterium]